VDAVHPSDEVTLRDTSYTPGEVYVCVGFSCEEVPPSPKLQPHAVTVPIGTVPSKLKLTVSSPHPSVSSAEKFGTRFSYTVISAVNGGLTQPFCVIVRVTEEFPVVVN
jgi:hypothetical protein